MKIQQYIEQTAKRMLKHDLFYGHGTDNPLDEAVYLIYTSLGIDFADGDQDNRVLTDIEITVLEQAVNARIEHRLPVAYIVGKAWFAGYAFYCDERALVPRSPIAELIRNRFEPLLPSYPLRILDLCAGGGSIGIASALEFADSKVDLADISVEALALASDNIALYVLADRVRTLPSDLFAAVDGKYDLIVSNPPYVSQQEYDELPDEFLHEPALGLVSEDEGLELPLRIMREAADYLNEAGVLVMEVGYSDELLARRLEKVPLLWLQFDQGGEGVLALTASQLRQYRECFK